MYQGVLPDTELELATGCHVIRSAIDGLARQPSAQCRAQCAVTDGAGSRRQLQQRLQTIHDVTRVVARNLARLSPAAHSSHAPAKNCNNLSWKQSITRPALASTSQYCNYDYTRSSAEYKV